MPVIASSVGPCSDAAADLATELWVRSGPRLLCILALVFHFGHLQAVEARLARRTFATINSIASQYTSHYMTGVQRTAKTDCFSKQPRIRRGVSFPK